MNFVRLLPVILSCLLMSAHFSRANMSGIAFVWLLIPFLLLIKREWVARVFQVLMVIGSLVWLETTFRLIKMRIALSESWVRLAIILFTVALFTLLSTLVFENKKLKERFKKNAI
jgi:tellurite resistance protein TehA-like permease